MSTNIFLGAYAWNDKFQRDDFYITFQEYLEADQNKLSAKIFLVKRDIKPAVRSYEYNYIYYLSRGKVDTFFTETEFDFGTIDQGTAVEHVWIFCIGNRALFKAK